MTDNIVYQASVTRQDNLAVESYIGLCQTTFKVRFTSHKSSFKNSNKRHDTTLSDYIWQLKDMNIPFLISWKIITKSTPYTPRTRLCNLCTAEKYYIICKPEISTLNSRNELSSTCRHKRKFLFSQN